MGIEDGTWTLERSREDFSPLDFAQRYSGSLSRDGARIEGCVGDLPGRVDLGARLRPHPHRLG
jgi:hypothetical protein